MKKKIIKRIAVITFFFVTGFSIIGCSRESVPNKNSQTPSVTQSNSEEEKIRIIKNIEEAGPGPLTKENVSIAGIYIGDSQEQVLKLYGKPTEKKILESTSNPMWVYKELGLSVIFVPDKGVVYNVSISSPSNLRTNTGIGMGDSIEDIVRNYDQVYGFKPDEKTNTQVIFVTGVNDWGTKSILCYPSLTIRLESKQIDYISLYSPSP
ncbi:MAG: hypothetical protein ACYC0Q_09710 [Eubacteriales bacterium]